MSSTGGAPPRRRRAGVEPAVGAAAGVVVWLVWLGWDRSPSRDVVTGTVQDPYVTLQVLGCAATTGVVAALLAARRHPVLAPLGLAGGSWVAWTTWAAATSGSPLFAVGAVLLGAGLAVGVSVSALVGWGLARAASRRRPSRAG
ncbi:hypothetical protein [uncultured Pseudokineococcus sp.]|uniref:hypothetical protein n=1 Tax=uncultured Pseudokineococcus sp. TaxID=1642928 RepID=UPI002627D509|nr:hypothetical protein [uncultured Pseudokineococcus sp.]